MVEQYAKQDDTSFSKLDTVSSIADNNDVSQALYLDAYNSSDKCMGGGPDVKCGAPSSVESTPPVLNKQSKEPDWFTRSDNNNDGLLSQREVGLAMGSPETRNLAVVRLMQYKFDELAGKDGLISIDDLELYVKRKQ